MLVTDKPVRPEKCIDLLPVISFNDVTNVGALVLVA